MTTDDIDQAGRLRSLADSLDCMLEEDLCLLAKITPSTADSWRRRGKGPAYILLGNRYLYPRKPAAEHLQSIVRERHGRSVAEGL